MQKIIPYLWFDDQAEEATKFYTSIFEDSSIGEVSRYDKASAEVSGQKEGSVLTVDFKIAGQQFGAMNGGPLFKINPSISFFVTCKDAEEVDKLWNKFSEGSKKVLMALDKYPFSEKYGWLEDKFGVSWQIGVGESKQKITPSLLFTKDQNGKAEEAVKFYTSLFDDSKVEMISRYEKGEGDTEGNVKFASFKLAGQYFGAMESGLQHDFVFNEAVSLLVNCKDQKEVDYFWDKFIADGGEESQCGWLKDKYGVSWQIVPIVLGQMLGDKDKEKAGRAMKAMLEMIKIDLDKLQKAFDG